MLPIDVLVPDEIVDPPTMIPPPEAFAIPCPFSEAKGLVASADGIWIALPPIIIPAELCAMRIPLVVVSLLPLDRRLPSITMPPLGCAASVCPAAATCATATPLTTTEGDVDSDGLEATGAFGSVSGEGSSLLTAGPVEESAAGLLGLSSFGSEEELCLSPAVF